MGERGALSPSGVAEWLDLDVSTVYRLMKQGEIPYVVIGKSRRTAVSALERLVDQGVVTGDFTLADEAVGQ